MSEAVRWCEFEAAAPELAAAGHTLLHHEPGREALFEFLIDRALLTTYGPRPSLPSSATKRHA